MSKTNIAELTDEQVRKMALNPEQFPDSDGSKEIESDGAFDRAAPSESTTRTERDNSEKTEANNDNDEAENAEHKEDGNPKNASEKAESETDTLESSDEKREGKKDKEAKKSEDGRDGRDDRGRFQKSQKSDPKEEARKDKTWVSLNHRRDELDKRDADLEKKAKLLEELQAKIERGGEEQMRRIQQLEANMKAKQEEEELKNSPEAFEQAAKRYRAQGNEEMAKYAEEAAENARQQSERRRQHQARLDEQNFQSEFDRWNREAIKELPSVGDTSTEDFALVKQLWDKSSAHERRNPRHAYILTQYVKNQRRAEKAEKEASKVPVLEKEKAELLQEIQALKAKLAPSSTPSRTAGTRPAARDGDYANMTDEQVRAKMKEEDRKLAKTNF